MKAWRLRFTPEASRLTFSLHPEMKKQIKKALNDLRQNPYAGKDLQEELSGFKTQRLKQYRIIYGINESQTSLQGYYIGRRRDVYEQFRLLAAELLKASANEKEYLFLQKSFYDHSFAKTDPTNFLSGYAAFHKFFN
jgi:mRNA interferase RelE/StbE